MGCAEEQDVECACLIDETMREVILDVERLEIWNSQWGRADRFPELAQFFDALFWSIAGDESRVH